MGFIWGKGSRVFQIVLRGRGGIGNFVGKGGSPSGRGRLSRGMILTTRPFSDAKDNILEKLDIN